MSHWQSYRFNGKTADAYAAISGNQQADRTGRGDSGIRFCEFQFPDDGASRCPELSGVAGQCACHSTRHAWRSRFDARNDYVEFTGSGSEQGRDSPQYYWLTPRFWSPTGTTSLSDPHVLYDPVTNRWYASSIADFQTINSAIVFAVSDSANPMGTWKFYRIAADPTHVNWADFPDIGYNQTWIAISANMFTVSANNFSGTALWVIQKSTALSGGPLTFTYFPVGSDNFGGITGFGIRICQTFGNEPKLYLVDNSGETSSGVGPSPSVPDHRHGTGSGLERGVGLALLRYRTVCGRSQFFQQSAGCHAVGNEHKSLN